MTVANVSVPRTSPARFGAATSQGTCDHLVCGRRGVTVPLTGWLAARFGAVRLFTARRSVRRLFHLCGLAHRSACWWSRASARPVRRPVDAAVSDAADAHLPEDCPAAIGLWSMTTLVAPVIGPDPGGGLCDEFSWSWILPDQQPDRDRPGFYTWRLIKRYRMRRAASRSTASARPAGGLGRRAAADARRRQEPGLVRFDPDRDAGDHRRLRLCRLPDLGTARGTSDRRPLAFRHRGFTVSVVTISLTFAAFSPPAC